MMGFGKRRPPPGPALDEHGRPIIVRWSPEHLARLCAENPSFQVMTVDGLQWIDPFTKHLIPAAFDWQQAAIAWMSQHRPWRQQDKPLKREVLHQVRWAHFLHHHFSELAGLRFFLPDGRWLNPLNGEWVEVGKLQAGQLSPAMRARMAQALAQCELAGGGSTLREEYSLKRAYDNELNKLVEQKKQRQSQSLAPVSSSPPKSAAPPVGVEQGLSISARRKTVQHSSSSQHINSLPTPPVDGDASIPSHFLRELHSAGYTLGECLGRGGMAAVYKALQRSLDRDVALKIRVPQGDTFSNFVERFMREARTAAKISSPYVVTIYDVGSTTSLVYMSLQYFPGGDLAQQLKRIGPFRPSEGLRCVSEILKGLAAIHDGGFVHRDIKTANCFIAEDGRVAVGDLGIASDFEHERHITNPNAIVGTPAFMPPEQTIPGAQLDARSDIYAAGVVGFHLISGQIPFDGEHPMVILRRLIAEPTPDLRDILPQTDPRVAGFIRRLMDKDPDQRPADAHQAAAEADAIIADLAVKRP